MRTVLMLLLLAAVIVAGNASGVEEVRVEGLRPNEAIVTEGKTETRLVLNETIQGDFRRIDKTVEIKTRWQNADGTIVYTVHDQRVPILKQPVGWLPAPTSIEIRPNGRTSFSLKARSLRYNTDEWHKLWRGRLALVKAEPGWRMKAGGKIIRFGDDILKVRVKNGTTTVEVGKSKVVTKAKRLLIWNTGPKPTPVLR